MDAQGTADYRFILAGSSLSTKSGNKYTGNIGDLDWEKNICGTYVDVLKIIVVTQDMRILNNSYETLGIRDYYDLT